MATRFYLIIGIWTWYDFDLFILFFFLQIFDFMAFLVISFWVAYLVTVIIDAPCSTLIKMAIEGGNLLFILHADAAEVASE